MLRRELLVGAVAGGGALALADPGPALAAAKCSAGGLCHVAIPTFAHRAPARDCQQWCWAATLQSVFATQGYVVSQQQIVRKLWDRPICAPAQPYQIWLAARGVWRDVRGRPFTAELTSIYDPLAGIVWPEALEVVIAELAAGRPVICGALSHAMAISALAYQRTPFGLHVHSVTVRDPSPASAPERRMSGEELAGTTFLATVVVR